MNDMSNLLANTFKERTLIGGSDLCYQNVVAFSHVFDDSLRAAKVYFIFVRLNIPIDYEGLTIYLQFNL